MAVSAIPMVSAADPILISLFIYAPKVIRIAEPTPTEKTPWPTAAAMVALAELWGEPFLKTPAVVKGIEQVRLPGRFETVARAPDVIVDVAHNEASAHALAAALSDHPSAGRTWAVFSAFGDKPVEAMAAALADEVDHWWVAGLDGPRGLSAEALVRRLKNGGITTGLDAVKSIPQALDQSLAQAQPDDRIVVFGSFQVLSQVASRWGREGVSNDG